MTTEPTNDKPQCEEAVIQKIRQRRDAGRRKYGVSMERTDLSRLDWLNHAQQEGMDFVIYLEKLIQQEQSSVCEWTENESHGYWEGSCGLAWELTTGTPETNGVWCCPRCGRRVTTNAQSETPANDDIEIGISTTGRMVVRMTGTPEIRLDRDWAERLHARIGEVLRQMPTDQAQART